MKTEDIAVIESIWGVHGVLHTGSKYSHFALHCDSAIPWRTVQSVHLSRSKLLGVLDFYGELYDRLESAAQSCAPALEQGVALEAFEDTCLRFGTWFGCQMLLARQVPPLETCASMLAQLTFDRYAPLLAQPDRLHLQLCLAAASLTWRMGLAGTGGAARSLAGLAC